MSVHDTQNPEIREAALQAAVDAVRDGKLIVLPTDTVYGIGADAFTPDAIEALLEAKGRGRDTPPPVLVGDPAVLLALATDVPDYVEDLTDAFWPGPLTLILRAQPSLTWDLGETRGTVALRMPDHEIALELLRRTGPLAVSSANRHGKAAAQTVLDAATQLGDTAEEYLDAGNARLGTGSTIIDTTVEPPEIVRAGALSQEEIVEAVGDIFTAPEPEHPEPEQDEDGKPTDTTDSAEAGEVAEAGETDAQDTATSDGEVPSDTDPGSPVEAEAEPAAGVLDLPAEPELEDLAADAETETPLETMGGSTGADGSPHSDPDPAAGGRPENSPG
ncbi:MAG TPA: threonylcarbamoyl-AMP synthase [Candidatus Brachybacterium merdavium]|uniref:L-threonylcarbamoyladenylate synthase n=1 Tax=Candidatus Brachybacterium merdavium TaxID=2838513 RepID=A0A9D2LD68_9MICO|nr:threonylcarbamoyl-AMP synthase [Candidatus Brachybacterium merdavium]